ncbi:hypothetical protein MSG28_014902, partial [Choristoneura fumiferana]
SAALLFCTIFCSCLLPSASGSLEESCDNRTYGYYADVDNDCQLFHEVLVCTRPRDAINCEDSPMYYDLNMEIGKETNDTKSETDDKENANAENINKETTENKEPSKERVKVQRRKPSKKQNLIVESLLREVVKDEIDNFKHKNLEMAEIDPVMEIEPKIEGVDEGIPVIVTEEDENSRLFSERSLKRNRKLKRGLLRFKADV